jgi:uncharacterized protein with HEPN domain
VPAPLTLANPDIPWSTMAAVRNRIVHGCFGIDGSILFTTIDQDLKHCCRTLKRWRAHMAQPDRTRPNETRPARILVSAT